MPSTMTVDTSFQPSNSVDLLQSRARKVADQSLQSTRRMREVADESKEIAVKTAAALDEQGEKLDHTRALNKNIKEDIRESEKVITQMEMCCGLCVLPWNRLKSDSNKKANKAVKAEKEVVVSEQPPLIIEDSMAAADFPRITKDALEDEMGENLAHVHSTIKNLKHFAADMNAEVRSQNKQIDKLINKADNNDQQVISATHRTDKLQR